MGSATETVEVGRAVVSYRRCGPEDAPTVLLVHGGAAHSGWWDDVAPLLARGHQVVMPDLSGHGASTHRPEYSADLWAAELAAVLRASTDRSAAVVGHSMGGLVGIAAAARSPELVAAVVLVDTRLPLQGLAPPTSPPRYFETETEALDRFRLLPDRTAATQARLRRVARTGLIEAPRGWRWRFDPAVRRRLTNDRVRADLAVLAESRCPVGFVRGAETDMGGPVSLATVEEWLGHRVPSAVVPEAFHHVPLDQPAGCAEGVVKVLDDLGWWQT